MRHPLNRIANAAAPLAARIQIQTRSNRSDANRIQTFGSIARYDELLGPLYRRNRSPTTARAATNACRGGLSPP